VVVGSDQAGASDAKTPEDGDPGKVSFLDQALWRQLREAKTPDVLAGAWLALLCRIIDAVERGVVVLGAADSGPFAPAAYWPGGESGQAGLVAAAETAMAERRGIVQGRSRAPDTLIEGGSYVAYPFLIDDHLYGVVALEIAGNPGPHLRSVMRQIQWGAVWIESMLQRQIGQRDRLVLEKTTAALDFIATSLEEERFVASCTATVTALSARLDCDRVSVGFLKGGHSNVVTVSHSARFGKRMNMIRLIGAAMDEAIDQRTIIKFPLGVGDDLFITRAHEDLSQTHGAGAILTIPLWVKDHYVGALTFERPADRPFDSETIELGDCVASVLGPILEEKRCNDRWLIAKAGDSLWRQLIRLFGPSFVGRKLLAVLAVGIIAFFYFAVGDYRVTSSARIEGQVRRVLVAPYDGYIAAEYARAGDNVRKGKVLAQLDDKDLMLERLQSVTSRQQRLREYDQALAERERAKANIIQTQIEQASAQIALIDQQLARAKLIAPFHGLVVSGDLSQSVGATVKRGDVLFEITPLNAYRVNLLVDESEIGEIRNGLTGTLLISSILDEPFPFVVTRITPVAEVKEGRNLFRVEARLNRISPRLRPGMEGIGKIYVARRRLIWIWTRTLIQRIQIWLWYWLP